ncbi:hypothetical protein DF143_32740 [Burkholderia cenocepacia]|nr:hypothetical protein DF143_32740 [Burkholderia cenocepacia]RQV35063.1 hypothetical protein DF033_32070 [Burkholderia cenocepacia]
MDRLLFPCSNQTINIAFHFFHMATHKFSPYIIWPLERDGIRAVAASKAHQLHVLLYYLLKCTIYSTVIEIIKFQMPF